MVYHLILFQVNNKPSCFVQIVEKQLGTNTQVYIEETAFYKRFVFPNGNCREIYPDGRIETCYALSQIHKIEFPNGCTLIFFPDGQLERHLPDKRIEVIYADGSLGLVSKDGNKEKVFLGNGKVVYRNRMSNSISERLYETTKERR